MLYRFSILPTTTSSPKNRFYLQQLPKKGHFLKEMHHIFFRKKVQNFFAPAALYSWTTGGGCYRISIFCASVFCALYLSLDDPPVAAKRPPKRAPLVPQKPQHTNNCLNTGNVAQKTCHKGFCLNIIVHIYECCWYLRSKTDPKWLPNGPWRALKTVISLWKVKWRGMRLPFVLRLEFETVVRAPSIRPPVVARQTTKWTHGLNSTHIHGREPKNHGAERSFI